MPSLSPSSSLLIGAGYHGAERLLGGQQDAHSQRVRPRRRPGSHLFEVGLEVCLRVCELFALSSWRVVETRDACDAGLRLRSDAVQASFAGASEPEMCRHSGMCCAEFDHRGHQFRPDGGVRLHRTRSVQKVHFHLRVVSPATWHITCCRCRCAVRACAFITLLFHAVGVLWPVRLPDVP